MPGPASPSPGSACAPSLAFSPSSLLPPLLSPLPSSIFSFPLPPLPGPPSSLPPVLPPCPPGSPLFGISWGPPPEAGEGALWTALSPGPSHTAQRRSISPLSIRSSGLEGAQPSVPPGSVSVCRVRAGPGPGRLGSLPAGGGPTSPRLPRAADTLPHQGPALHPPSPHVLPPQPFLTPSSHYTAQPCPPAPQLLGS